MKNKIIMCFILIILVSITHAGTGDIEYIDQLGWGINDLHLGWHCYESDTFYRIYDTNYLIFTLDGNYTITIHRNNENPLTLKHYDSDKAWVTSSESPCTSKKCVFSDININYNIIELSSPAGYIDIYKNSTIEYLFNIAPSSRYKLYEGGNSTLPYVNQYSNDGRVIMTLTCDKSVLFHTLGGDDIDYFDEISDFNECNILNEDGICIVEVENYNISDMTQSQYYWYVADGINMVSPVIEIIQPQEDILNLDNMDNEEFSIIINNESRPRVIQSMFTVDGYGIDIHHHIIDSTYIPSYNFTFGSNAKYFVTLSYELTCGDSVYYSWVVNVGNYMILQGYVFNNVTLQPISNVEVVLHNPDITANYCGTTDINGYFYIDDIIEDNYTSWIDNILGDLSESYYDVHYTVNITQSQCGTKMCRYDYYLQPLTSNSLITVYFLDKTNHSNTGGFINPLFNFSYSVSSSLYSPEKEILRIENGEITLQESDIISIKKNISGLADTTQYIQYYVESSNVYENIFYINKTGYYAYFSQYSYENGGDSDYDFADSFEYPIFSDVILWHSMRNISDINYYDIILHFVDGNNNSINLNNVDITLYNIRNLSVYNCITNISGKCEFNNMTSSKYKIYASKFNYLTISDYLFQLNENSKYQISMYEDIQNVIEVDGKVTDCEYGVKLNNVNILFHNLDTLNNYSCKTNQDGLFSINLMKGLYNIILSRELYNDFSFNKNIVVDFSFTGNNELCLSSDESLSLVLINIKNNESINLEDCDIYITHSEKIDWIQHEKTDFYGNTIFNLEKMNTEYDILIECELFESLEEKEYVLSDTESFNYVIYLIPTGLEDLIVDFTTPPSSLEDLIRWLGRYIWGLFFIILLIFIFYVGFFMIKKMGIL